MPRILWGWHCHCSSWAPTGEKMKYETDEAKPLDNYIPQKALEESSKAKNPPPLPGPKPPDAVENPADPYSQTRVNRKAADYIDTDSIGGD
jgi:hypothetical protein